MSQQQNEKGEIFLQSVDLVTPQRLEATIDVSERERVDALFELLEEAMARTGSKAMLDEFEAFEKEKYPEEFEGVSPQVTHTRRVGGVGLVAALKLGLSPELAFRIGYSGATHDMGKRDPEINDIVNSGEFIPKDDPRREIINRHASCGAEMLTDHLRADTEFDVMINYDAIFVAGHHHDSPALLEELAATAPTRESYERVEMTRFMVAMDIYDALTDPLRTYRDGVDPQDVASKIVREHLGEDATIFGHSVGEVLETLAAVKAQFVEQ